MMAPYLILAVGSNGHFVNVREIMASSDAAAFERARQLLDQFDLEVWSGRRKIGQLSARRRARSILKVLRGWMSLITGRSASLALRRNTEREKALER
jgi:hypothetical protein